MRLALALALLHLMLHQPPRHSPLLQHAQLLLPPPGGPAGCRATRRQLRPLLPLLLLTAAEERPAPAAAQSQQQSSSHLSLKGLQLQLQLQRWKPLPAGDQMTAAAWHHLLQQQPLCQ